MLERKMNMNALQKIDSAISSPSTPNSSLSSQSNLVGGGTPSPNTPSPATPTQQSSTPLGHSNHTVSSSCSGSGSTSGHKNSLKGTKLARRARSFKDDLFEKISLMRTPTNTLGRSHSPHSPRSKHGKPPPTAEEVAKSAQSLDTHVKDISNALKHFRDVILKKKLEVLPGNATVILETIASMYAVIQSYGLNENSSVLLSATQQVYQSLGKLIKLCDEVMLRDESKQDESDTLWNDNVKEIVELLGDAVRNLVNLAQQKMLEREENAFKYETGSAEIAATPSSHNHLMRPPVEVAGQRTSLPDITLTPKERDILEKTNSNPIRASHSTESILRDTSPPPKPPLPNRTKNPPPLPPKRRSQQQPYSNNISMNSDLDCSSEFSCMNYGVDHLSVRSRSPDENSSQCSLDSALNHSREEEETKASVLESLEDDVEKLFISKSLTSGGKPPTVNNKGNIAHNKINAAKEELEGVGISGGGGTGRVGASSSVASIAAKIQNVTTAPLLAATGAANAKGSGGGGDNSVGVVVDLPDNGTDECDFVQRGESQIGAVDKLEMRKNANNRHSNESGFVSMTSVRTSVSTRSSDYGYHSAAKLGNSDIAAGAMESSSSEFQMNQHQQQQTIVSSRMATTTSSVSGSSMSTIEQYSSSGKISSLVSDDNHSISYTSSSSPDHLEGREKSLVSQMQSFSSLTKANSLDTSSSDGMGSHSDLLPPALPPKSARTKEARLGSQYDNFDDMDVMNSFAAHELAELRPHHYNNNLHTYHHYASQWQTKHQSLIGGVGIMGSCNAIGSVDINYSGEKPPPLPQKQRMHILAYMEVCSQRNTVNIPHSQTVNIMSVPKDLSPPEHDTPPALPPKNYKQRKANSTPPTIITTPPPSPKPTHLSADLENCGRPPRVLSGAQGSEQMSTVCEEINDLTEEEQANVHQSHKLPNEKENHRRQSPLRRAATHEGTPISTPDLVNDDHTQQSNIFSNDKHCGEISALSKDDNPPHVLEEIDITKYLVLKKIEEDGPEVKGGYIDALIVHASRVQKDNAFTEAFITTFRTFIPPIDVLEKLIHRYTVFFCLNEQKQRAAKETFSLLVRVVNDLTPMDLTIPLLILILEFIYQLVCSGQLYLAKLLRIQFVEKVGIFKEQKLPIYKSDMHSTVINQASLLDFKSADIAEQMTLLDAELFQKIEIPEVLLFAKEQCEEKSPNLNKFTEHFNNMSYWARSKILTLEDAKEREKHVIKFIKIMKHLRKMNNYNSYLALLSALDSAPIRRLEWHKTITEGLKEYCTLIDSSSSFRAYRQTLAATNPPCIPYIGLVLQDLTFVHVGNPDYLREGVINFSKRWQQYNIIVNMKRFKKCEYGFRRNERIIKFFENFKHSLCEEQMWQISESIKPRGKRPVLT